MMFNAQRRSKREASGDDTEVVSFYDYNPPGRIRRPMEVDPYTRYGPLESEGESEENTGGHGE
jgi:hypothetical protein